MQQLGRRANMMARKHMQARENEGQGQKLETKCSHGLPGPTHLPCAHPSGPDDIPTKQISMAEEETGTQRRRVSVPRAHSGRTAGEPAAGAIMSI